MFYPFSRAAADPCSAAVIDLLPGFNMSHEIIMMMIIMMVRMMILIMIKCDDQDNDDCNNDVGFNQYSNKQLKEVLYIRPVCTVIGVRST